MPIQVKVTKQPKKKKRKKRLKKKTHLCSKEKKQRKYKTKIESKRKITPPSFLGTARKIAYANKKYHSGWMCKGVLKGSAREKFSGSPKEKGNR